MGGGGHSSTAAEFRTQDFSDESWSEELAVFSYLSLGIMQGAVSLEKIISQALTGARNGRLSPTDPNHPWVSLRLNVNTFFQDLDSCNQITPFGVQTIEITVPKKFPRNLLG